MGSERPWALVTGASSGLGVDFARQLAERGWNLVLTARRREQLEHVAAEVRQRWGAVCTVVDGDLGDPRFRDTLIDIATSGRKLQCVVNNAGFGQQGAFLDGDWARWSELMNLNMTALTDLSYRLGRHMRDHGLPSHLVNVASVAAWQPVPQMAVYAASKSYVRDFTEALALELGSADLQVTCVCPGGTRTAFVDNAGMALGRLAEASLQASAPVVNEALGATFDGRRLVVTGWLNKLMVWGVRWLPRGWAARIAEYGMRRAR
jgi:short-subunit dehydrogenase